MKLIPIKSSGCRNQQGIALTTVLVLGAISMIALTAAMKWSSTSASLTERSNQYYTSLYAAEGAVEKVCGSIADDFLHGDHKTVFDKLDAYRAMVPTPAESAVWNNFAFGDNTGALGKTSVERSVAPVYTNSDTKYTGLLCTKSTYTVISHARKTDGMYDLTAGLFESIDIETIPTFQYAIFYGMLMEISCGQDMNITGRVHANSDMYVLPDANLAFLSDVTAVGNISFRRAPGDSRVDGSGNVGMPKGTVTYKKRHDSGSETLSIPIGTNNSAEAVRDILVKPPAGEDPNSPLGKQRYYNKADLIVSVSDTINTNGYTTNVTKPGSVWITNIAPILATNIVIVGTSGPTNGTVVTITNSILKSFVTCTTNYFRDFRESKNVEPIDINVGSLATNTALTAALGHPAKIIYVQDTRTASINASTDMQAVRLYNGQTIPSSGLTVATERPVYIQGHYNCPTAALGTANTTNAYAASVIADAVTLLSANWTDQNSRVSTGVADRPALPTTYNVAMISGIVPTNPSITNTSNYGGGAENFPRFLEDWSPDDVKKICTYNGSMVVMFPSKYAISKWGTGGVYDPPARNWAFDLNYMDVTKLPPGTPCFNRLVRSTWDRVAGVKPH